MSIKVMDHFFSPPLPYYPIQFVLIVRHLAYIINIFALPIKICENQHTINTLGFPGGSDGKESTCNNGRPGFNPWVEKGTATHSSILIWRIPWTEPRGLQSMRLQIVRHDWVTFTHSSVHYRNTWSGEPTPWGEKDPGDALEIVEYETDLCKGYILPINFRVNYILGK